MENFKKAVETVTWYNNTFDNMYLVESQQIGNYIVTIEVTEFTPYNQGLYYSVVNQYDLSGELMYRYVTDNVEDVYTAHDEALAIFVGADKITEL